MPHVLLQGDHSDHLLTRQSRGAWERPKKRQSSGNKLFSKQWQLLILQKLEIIFSANIGNCSSKAGNNLFCKQWQLLIIQKLEIIFSAIAYSSKISINQLLKYISIPYITTFLYLKSNWHDFYNEYEFKILW